ARACGPGVPRDGPPPRPCGPVLRKPGRARSVESVAFDQTQLTNLSTRPGVYLFKDDRGRVLYVGKAKSLRSRVRSYFRAANDLSAKNQELVRRIESLDTIVVGSEAEALILEA